MNKREVFKSAVVALSAMLFMTIAFAKGGAFKAQYKSNELLVKFKSDVTQSEALTVLEDMGVDLKESLGLTFGEYYLVRTDVMISFDSAMTAMSGHPSIEFAEPNFLYYAIDDETPMEKILRETYSENLTMATPTDPKFGLLWGLNNNGINEPDRKGKRSSTKGVAGADISALKAWGITQGSSDITISIIDTGVQYNHPDLEDNMWTNTAELNGKDGVDDDGNGYVDDIHGYDFANSDGDPMDDHSHGTHVAGTIGATHDNGIGVAGVMRKVKMVGVKFLTGSGSGSLSDAVKAIDYSIKIDVDIMSNSWGGGGYSKALEEAIVRAKDSGIVFVAAAGNSSTNNDQRPHYPSNYNVENIISVAAHNSSDQLASFSCYGATTVHVAAPGRNILSTVKDSEYAVYSGTSMAAPHVTGALGLLLSNEGSMSLASVKERVMATSEYVSSYRRKMISHGRLNAYNLLIDRRPERKMPKDSDWKELALKSSFESSHPYDKNQTLSRVFEVSGAKYIRVVLKKYDTEERYDNIVVRDPVSRADVESISGSGDNYKSDYVEGSKIEVEFKSDYSLNMYGFVIEKIEYVPGDKHLAAN